jgi:hypothetical protein
MLSLLRKVQQKKKQCQFAKVQAHSKTCEGEKSSSRGSNRSRVRNVLASMPYRISYDSA